ncbi:MAG: 4-hydroxy-tetrahydrodipicolinate synthase [bacterium]
MFSGSYVALVTPFKNGKIDEKKLKNLVHFHIEQGTSGLVPCGTTGESSTLLHSEREKVIDIVVKEAGGSIPVIAGTGFNSTEETIEMSRFAKKAGAHSLLLVVPYYNKPTPEGLYQHFSHVAAAVDLPVILYNIPGRTGVNLLPETVIRLAQDNKNIVGIKEASGNMDQASEIIRTLGENFCLLSGDDSLTLPLLAIGGKGVISVAANLIPRDVKEMVECWNKGDISRARELHLRMFKLIKALFIETNPIPVKTAMGMLNMCLPDLRLPLLPMSEEHTKKLRETLKDYGLNI